MREITKEATATRVDSTPRGEGEAWCAFLDALDEFEAAANLWVDPQGPSAEDMARLDRARQRVIECARILAALRSEAQGEVWREIDGLLARLERFEYDAAGESDEYWRVVAMRDRIAAAWSQDSWAYEGLT